MIFVKSFNVCPQLINFVDVEIKLRMTKFTENFNYYHTFCIGHNNFLKIQLNSSRYIVLLVYFYFGLYRGIYDTIKFT